MKCINVWSLMCSISNFAVIMIGSVLITYFQLFKLSKIKVLHQENIFTLEALFITVFFSFCALEYLKTSARLLKLIIKRSRPDNDVEIRNLFDI